MPTSKLVAALTVAGAMSLGSYAPAHAAPVTPLSAAAKPIGQDSGAVQVRWGGWHGGGWGHGGWGGGVGAGALAAGALIGATIAAPSAYGGYYPYGG
jgi:hypothetical protein